MFNIGKTYKFDTIAPGVLGTYSQVNVVVSECDFGIAATFADVLSIHDAVVGENGPLSIKPEDATYVIIEDVATKKKVPLAIQWIITSTIQDISSSNKVQITLTGLEISDMSIINEALSSIVPDGVTVTMEVLT